MSLHFTKEASDCSQTEPGVNRLVLELRGMGPIPSFKNAKRSVIRNGKASPVTDKKVKHWMQQAVHVIAYQLCSGTPITGAGTQTGQCPPSWTALLPHDDCWTVIPEQSVRAELCRPGEEGATITIERI